MSRDHLAAVPFDFGAEPGYVALTVQPHGQAYDLVLERAGAFPRDGITRRVVEETRTRGGSMDG